jgi:NAD(P)-dependent dehydrogenase (short-subunit alcohol dehydrogenase family)
LRFDGRVAIVTGAGRGLGRAYAGLLAARGAAVVVNDLGSSMEGQGVDHAPASDVATEITAAGGSALADSNDVASVEGAERLVAIAVDRFGRIDIVVNNAGIIRWAGPPEVDLEDLRAHLAVHTEGSFNVTRAAWPHFLAQGYGRVVMTTSSGVFGLPANTSYAAAKGGVIGLTRSLAVAGRKHGILVNAVAPAAATRMAGETASDRLAPELVAPLVTYLVHESCAATGEIYAAGGGRFARIFLGTTPGYVDTAATIENVAEHWSQINDETGYVVPADLMAWSAAFLAHLPTSDDPEGAHDG